MQVLPRTHHCRPVILPSAMHLGLAMASSTAGKSRSGGAMVAQLSSMETTASRTCAPCSRGEGRSHDEVCERLLALAPRDPS
jgi:hypothetical protein